MVEVKERAVIWRVFDVLTVAAAMTAAIVSILAFVISTGIAKEANGIASEALGLAQKATAEEIARHVYVGEIPADLEILEGESHVAVINSNPVAVYDVLLEGCLNERCGVINVWTIQACTGYTLPSDFEAKSVKFFDGTRAWTRTQDGELRELNERHILSEEGLDDPPRTFPASGCE